MDLSKSSSSTTTTTSENEGNPGPSSETSPSVPSSSSVAATTSSTFSQPSTSSGSFATSSASSSCSSSALTMQETSCSTSNKKDDNDDGDDDDDEDDPQITMKQYVEYIEEVEDEQDSAIRVLGEVDPNECTYLKGYHRQALYACQTCEMKIDPETGEKHLAGVCLACSEQCHAGHQLEELYTKRNFCCDCGNDKFVNTTCKLFKKIGFNEDNAYNHNFSGLYCYCRKPYPDPAGDNSHVMISCCICEDWFHDNHLDCFEENMLEMICRECVLKHDFLVYYADAGCFEAQKAAENKIHIPKIKPKTEEANTSSSSNSTENSALSDKAVECKLVELKQKYFAKHQTASIDPKMVKSMYQFNTDWRLNLCKCPACVTMYENTGVPFITSQEDMICFYEKNNLKAAAESDPINKLDPVKKINLANAYNRTKQVLKRFFEECENKGEVVKVEHVREFMERVQNQLRESNKRPRMYVPPNNCR